MLQFNKCTVAFALATSVMALECVDGPDKKKLRRRIRTRATAIRCSMVMREQQVFSGAGYVRSGKGSRTRKISTTVSSGGVRTRRLGHEKNVQRLLKVVQM
ncbi:hypothetical protein SARC_12559 [Sphaeroforma arctica JP610]|uniref:Uncharacterized protein n=1 Tax=Sphaeroforma arctica JP610 TaxID=667725 RepID=A0A0L0FDS2_9EUKA|nr:hypothetical protein SARC_12559 [Sphaeroforma arctica JP610]KNC74905.1 hypothetical protein SARC_12559 [Sphaeroforma arctica JP610]|eukprot:XP_014148807.1 hypothetical protein SARC_12559 [Sphaeroforma arctica JP610]